MKSNLFMLIGALPVLVLALQATAQSSDTHSGTVVELFSSQSCNTCPPANAYLGELAKRDDLIALTFNVDYWDYLGWRDTLASPLHTKRQRSYSKAMHESYVYTPQMVIGGLAHAVGSDRRGVERAIVRVQELSRSRVDVVIAREEEKVLIRLPEGPAPVEATVWLVRYDRVRKVAIRHGENRGRTIAYHNVVRELRNIGLWRGESMEIAFMAKDLIQDGRDGCAVIVQQGGHGPILGAAAIKFAPRP